MDEWNNQHDPAMPQESNDNLNAATPSYENRNNDAEAVPSAEQPNTEQLNAEQSSAGQPNAEPQNAEQSTAEQLNAEPQNAEQSTAEQLNAEQQNAEEAAEPAADAPDTSDYVNSSDNDTQSDPQVGGGEYTAPYATPPQPAAYYRAGMNGENTENGQPFYGTYVYNEPRAEKVKNRGLKVFCLALAAVLVVTLSVCAGYLASEYRGKIGGSSTTTSRNAPKLDLADRPEDDSELADNYTEAYKKVQKSVVNILVYSSDSVNESSSKMSIASGVVYSKDGYIVTNDHIYDSISNAKFKVRFYDGKEYDAVFVAGDTRSDLAVLKLKKKVSGLTAATFGDSTKAIVGEQVITVGYPSNYGDDATLTHGILSAVNRRVTGTATNYASSFLQTDATINPGNSGGALCNMYGQVIGITSSKLTGTYEATTYAIPTKTMKRVVTGLISYGCVKDRAKLGITYTELNSVTADANGLPIGLYIGTISSESDLFGKGYSEGDVITHVGGKKITTSDVLLSVIEDAKAGDTIELTIYSAKKKESGDVSVKLLSDKGSSSYNNSSSSKSSDGTSSGSSDKNKSKDSSDNGGTFDFPLN